MYCPVCRSEYRDGFTVCADCEVALVGEMPAERGREGDLVTVLETDDASLLGLAASRLTDVDIPSVQELGYADEHGVRRRCLRVGPPFAHWAELCLTGIAEEMAATRRELERHGLADRAEGGDAAPGDAADRTEISLMYCPRCGSEHRGFSSCVDCGVPLVSSLPERPEDEPAPVFATLDAEVLATARRVLHAAGIPFEWGRLGPGGGTAGEPSPSPLVQAGYVIVSASREDEARELLTDLADPSGCLVPLLRDHEEDDDEAGTLYCPRCGGEFRPGFSQCADCHIPLVSKRPARDAPDAALADGGTAAPDLTAGSGADAWWAVRAGLPDARADYARIHRLHLEARWFSTAGFLFLPWITPLIAFRKAGQALAIGSSYQPDEPLLGPELHRLRLISAVWLSLAWGAAIAAVAKWLGWT
jgi:hypothetical protein